MNRRNMLACAALCLAPLAELSAQENPAVSIDQLVAMAMDNNAELGSFQAEADAARGQRTQAGFFRNPEVSVEVGAREVRDSENLLQGNGTTFGVSLMQTFEFPGKGTLRKAIADKNIEIAELGLEQFRLSLAGRVRLLAYEHMAATAEADAAEEIYRQGSGLASRLGTAPDYGARLRIETRLVQASLVELGAAIKEACLRREDTRAQLNALLGRPQNLPLRISSAFVPPSGGFNESAVVFAAQNNNPLLKIRQKELERSARELTAARLDIAPDFAIGPFFSRDVAGDTEQNFGGAVTATVPLWDWNIGNIRTAKARAEGAGALRVKALRDVEVQIVNLLKAHELTRRQIGMIPPGLLENVREASGLAGTQLRNGSIGAQLYLDAQAAYLGALRTSQNAVLDAWRTFLDLNLLTGGSLDAPQEGRP